MDESTIFEIMKMFADVRQDVGRVSDKVAEVSVDVGKLQTSSEMSAEMYAEKISGLRSGMDSIESRQIDTANTLGKLQSLLSREGLTVNIEGGVGGDVAAQGGSIKK